MSSSSASLPRSGTAAAELKSHLLESQNHGRFETHERLKRTLYSMIKYNMQILGVIPHFKLQNNTKKKCKMQLNGKNEISDTCLRLVDLFCYIVFGIMEFRRMADFILCSLLTHILGLHASAVVRNCALCLLGSFRLILPNPLVNR